MLQAFGRGRGPHGVLLLHGFLGAGRNLATLARQLSERRADLRVLVPDLPGHGASPPLPPGADLATLAAEALAVADHHGLAGPLVVIGHSLGGRVGLELLREHPDRIAGVVLLDIAPGPIEAVTSASTDVLAVLVDAPAEVATRDEMRAWLEGRGLQGGIAAWLMTNLVDRGQAFGWRFDRAALADLQPRVLAADLWPVVARTPDRVRCIRGGRSPYVADDDVARFAALGCAPVVTLPGAGHFVHVDAPEALLDALTAALP